MLFEQIIRESFDVRILISPAHAWPKRPSTFSGKSQKRNVAVCIFQRRPVILFRCLSCSRHPCQAIFVFVLHVIVLKIKQHPFSFEQQPWSRSSTLSLLQKRVRRMILKKPAARKAASWNQVPYQRHSDGGGFLRVCQTKWRRTLQELLNASDDEILRILKSDHFLPQWAGGAVCPKCGEGVLAPLKVHAGRKGRWHRCNRFKCQPYVSPIYLHPIFTSTPGPEGHSLQLQSAALLLRLAHPHQSQGHRKDEKEPSLSSSLPRH